MVFPFIIRAGPVFGKGKGGGKPGKPSVIFHKISLPFLPGFPSGTGLEGREKLPSFFTISPPLPVQSRSSSQTFSTPGQKNLSRKKTSALDREIVL